MKYIVVEFDKDKVVAIYNLQGKTIEDALALIKIYEKVDSTKTYKIYKEVE